MVVACFESWFLWLIGAALIFTLVCSYRSFVSTCLSFMLLLVLLPLNCRKRRPKCHAMLPMISGAPFARIHHFLRRAVSSFNNCFAIASAVLPPCMVFLQMTIGGSTLRNLNVAGLMVWPDVLCRPMCATCRIFQNLDFFKPGTLLNSTLVLFFTYCSIFCQRLVLSFLSAFWCYQ